MIPIHGRMRQHDLETVIKCVFSVFNTPNATSATMVDSSKKPVTMTVTVSQSQSSQQRQPKIKNRHFPRIFGTIKAQSDKQRMVGPKQNVTGSNPVRSTKTVRNKGVSVGLKNPVSGFGAKRYKHGNAEKPRDLLRCSHGFVRLGFQMEMVWTESNCRDRARYARYMARLKRCFPRVLDTISPMNASQENLWPAPFAGKPLGATVVVPGSKSLSNRYLILAALGHRPVRLVGLLRSRDTELMMDALRALGVRCEIDEQVDTTVTVVPPSDGRFHGGTKVFCGLAGTVMRFVPGLAMFADGPVDFDGDEQAYARPMKPVLEGLEQLGALIEYHGEEGRLPFTITPPQTVSQRAEPSVVSIDSSGSSQFISGLLLIGSRVPGGLELHHTGEKTPSLPHIRMTVADLQGSGVRANADEYARVWTVQPGAVQLTETVTVEPDLSNAAPFLGAALIAGGTVRVPHWPESTTQPGGLLPGYLERMGAEISFPVIGGVRYCEVTGSGHINGLGDFDLTAAGEIAPSLAAILVFADKPTRMLGIGHLRGHETNRLEALVNEITRVGGEACELADGLEIVPVPAANLRPAKMETYADHRMATFAAMLGLSINGIQVKNIATTAKTLPDFANMWTNMLA